MMNRKWAVFFQFRLELEGQAGEIKDAIPITIGTIQDVRRAQAQKRRTTIYSTGPGAGSPNGESQYDVIGGEGGGIAGLEDVDLDQADMDAFRHPMAPGEVRQNILFADFSEMERL